MPPPDVIAGPPPELADRARSYLAGELEPVRPRHAATVVLVRDAVGGGLEVFLLRRVASMAFAPGMHVFPGGGVDPRDEGPGQRWSGPGPDAWGRAVGAVPGLARSLVCAAVRETFEESGVLLAGASAAEVVADTTDAAWEEDRLALVARSLSLRELLGRRDLVLRSDLLRAWTHWVTPEFEPHRYDTRFFLAALPRGQQARDVGGEADRVLWVRPADALAAHRRGEMAMMPPTLVTLGDLVDTASVEQALATPRRLAPILPRAVLEPGGDGVRLVLPGEVGYPAGPDRGTA